MVTSARGQLYARANLMFCKSNILETALRPSFVNPLKIIFYPTSNKSTT